MKKLNYLNKFKNFVNEFHYFAAWELTDYFAKDWMKKPVDKDDINSVDFEKLPENIKDELKSLKISDKEPGKRYYFNIKINSEPFYQIIEIENEAYLVRTEGYTYPRYIIKLENF